MRFLSGRIKLLFLWKPSSGLSTRSPCGVGDSGALSVVALGAWRVSALNSDPDCVRWCDIREGVTGRNVPVSMSVDRWRRDGDGRYAFLCSYDEAAPGLSGRDMVVLQGETGES